MQETKKPALRKEYTVKVDTHVHKGKAVAKNDKISLTEKQAERLKGMEVI